MYEEHRLGPILFFRTLDFSIACTVSRSHLFDTQVIIYSSFFVCTKSTGLVCVFFRTLDFSDYDNNCLRDISASVHTWFESSHVLAYTHLYLTSFLS